MATNASIESGIQNVLAQYGSLIEAYRGELPARVVAALIWHEVNPPIPCPKPTACCDERGLMQLWPNDRARYGMTSACIPGDCAASCAEESIRAGCAQWIAQNRAMEKSIPAMASAAKDADYWKMSWIYRGIGSGATKKLAEVSAGDTFASVLAYVTTASAAGTLGNLAAWFGSQSASSIATRVKTAQQWVDVALGAGGATGGGNLLILAVAAYFVVKYLIGR